MERVISISLGEVMLKGKNRNQFIDRIITHTKNVIKPICQSKIYKDMGKVYIKAPFEHFDEIIERVSHVFGIVYLSPCIKISREESLEEAILLVLNEEVNKNKNIKTFKAHTKRADKNYPLKSMEMNNKIGGIVLKNTKLNVDVHKPDLYVYCDVKKDIYIYTKKYEGNGGLPIGSNGKSLLLLSGGIDSPVAGFLMAKRGVKISALHFHSYPFTSDRAEEKVLNLARLLSVYTGEITLYSVNILPIQKEINKNCREDEMTILSRRFMMRIADEISKENGYNSIVTGENLGQVASQTINGLTCTNDVVSRIVFRPLIGLDKIDIIRLAEKIGTYETSILPFEDCCTVFLPKHPVLKPTIEQMEESEKKLNVEDLVKDAIKNMKIIKIGGEE